MNRLQNYQFRSRKEHISFTAPTELIVLNTPSCSYYNTTAIKNEMLLQALSCLASYKMNNLSIFLGLQPYCYITLLEIYTLVLNWSLRIFFATKFPSLADLRSYRFASPPRPMFCVTFIRMQAMRVTVLIHFHSTAVDANRLGVYPFLKITF